jgi:hypothetical protein
MNTGSSAVFERPLELKVSAPHLYYTKTYRINVRRNGVKIGSGSSTDPAYDYYPNLSNALSASINSNYVFLADGEHLISSTNSLSASGTICAVPGGTAVLKRNFTNGPMINFTGAFTSAFNFNRSASLGAGTLVIDGGGLDATDAAIKIDGNYYPCFYPGVIIQNNRNTSSAGNGGGISASNLYSGYLEGVVIQNNYAKNGGGVYIYTGTAGRTQLMIRGGTIIRYNEATSAGGGVIIYQDGVSDRISLDSSIIVEYNNAPMGGGVRTWGKPVQTSSNTIIRYNTVDGLSYYSLFPGSNTSGITDNSPNNVRQQ